MTQDRPPSSIAYAIPEHDRADGRVRRVLAFAAIGFGAVGAFSAVLYIALVLRLLPSAMYGAGQPNPLQMAFQSAGAVFELLMLIGGVLLLRADLPAGRWLIRIGSGGRVAILLGAIALALLTSPYPPSFTIADRLYMLIGNSIAYLIVPATFFALTFALPPLRRTA